MEKVLGTLPSRHLHHPQHIRELQALRVNGGKARLYASMTIAVVFSLAQVSANGARTRSVAPYERRHQRASFSALCNLAQGMEVQVIVRRKGDSSLRVARQSQQASVIIVYWWRP